MTRAARADLYGDAINDELVVKPGKRADHRAARLRPDRGRRRCSPAARSAVGGVGALLRRAQNGFVRSYALSLLGGVLLVVLALLAVNLA